MDVQLSAGQIGGVAADTVAILCFNNDKPRDTGLPKQVNDLTSGWLDEIYSAGEFRGKPLELAVLHRPAGMSAKRLAVVGAGDAAKLTPFEIRKAAGALVRAVKGRGSKAIALALDEPHASPEFVAAAVEGALLGDYEPDQLKTDPKKGEQRAQSFTLAVPAMTDEIQAAFQRGRILGECQNLARDLGNEPSNRLTPLRLADLARTMAAEQGLECEVLSQEQMRELGMGALLGVAQGSAEPPALIILRYRPAHCESPVHLGLVGKAVTFDTGGISIKPSDGMEKMKYDMMGGAAVIGAMRAIAQLKPAVPVTAYVPAVENMPSGTAQRPGDIVTSLNGKTVEVLNTDAEGRLILIDAMTYAKRQGCTHLVDAATLTGAIVVALGHIHTGTFTNNEEFQQTFLAAARLEGERCWPMPLDDDYKDYLKSAYADLPNIGGRWGGAITAAMFIKEFAEDTPWVHLDIAGTAWLDEGKPFLAKGPTGVLVRTFTRLAESFQ